MSTNSTGHKKGKTRSQVHCSLKLKELVGIPKNLDGSEVPTLRAALQQGMFIKEKMLLESDADTTKVKNRRSFPLNSTTVAKIKCSICPPSSNYFNWTCQQVR